MENTEVMLERIRTEMEGIDERVQKLEKLYTTVQEIAISVKEIALRQEMSDRAMQQIAEDVGQLKSKPAKMWETLVVALIGAAVGVFIEYVARMGN